MIRGGGSRGGGGGGGFSRGGGGFSRGGSGGYSRGTHYGSNRIYRSGGYIGGGGGSNICGCICCCVMIPFVIGFILFAMLFSVPTSTGGYRLYSGDSMIVAVPSDMKTLSVTSGGNVGVHFFANKPNTYNSHNTTENFNENLVKIDILTLWFI